jgi:hypothetical protein
MEMNFTKEEWETLKQAESVLSKLYYGKYLSNCPTPLIKQLIAIYQRATGSKSSICPHCSKDIANTLTYLARRYFTENKQAVKPKKVVKKNKI